MTKIWTLKMQDAPCNVLLHCDRQNKLKINNTNFTIWVWKKRHIALYVHRIYPKYFLKGVHSERSHDDLMFYISFNMKVNSRSWRGDNERISAMKCLSSWAEVCLWRDSNPGPSDQKSKTSTVRSPQGFFLFRVDLFSKGAWCTWKQTGSHKSCLPCRKWISSNCI